MIYKDFLVVGSGVAGLFSAIKLAEYNPDKQVLLLTKDKLENSNSYFAQGGISIVPEYNQELIESHIEDTLRVGGFHGSRDVVSMVCYQAPLILDELKTLGVNFDRTADGEYDLNKEGGHTYPRILHIKDFTGKHLMDQLIAVANSNRNLLIQQEIKCLDLLIENGECFGIEAYSKSIHRCIEIHSSATVLATGGLGQVFRYCTNPGISTGDGIAMAYRAGARLRDLEFVQFHPTSIYISEQKNQQVPIVSEAVRGKGAVLKNKFGDAFMKKYHVDGDLAPRDVVSRAIISEMKEHNSDHVFLDCRAIDFREFSVSFPQIHRICNSLGIKPENELIPVVPAAHFSCGGIEISIDGNTSIKRLFACGECAYTGMHGANRLASNSLLEALVFGKICAKTITCKKYNRTEFPAIGSTYVRFTEQSSTIKSMMLKIQDVMAEHFFVNCSSGGLQIANEKLSELSDQFNLLNNELEPDPVFNEIRNLLTTSRLIIETALKREVNKGCFYNTSLNEVELH